MYDKAKLYFSSRANLYSVIILSIILLAGVIRIYSLLHNWVIGSDDSRDVIISSIALSKRELPLIGPFSSAGPFVTGPIYYWVLMIGSFLFLPLGIASEWVMLLILSIINVGVFIYIGFLVRGKRLSILLGLLSATSFLLISFSLNLTNPTFIFLCTSLLLLFFTLYTQRKKSIYALLCGLIIGIALNMHYQAINLLIIAPFFLLISGITWKRKILSLLLFLFGVFVPMIPILWWDSHQHFSNVNNILDYLLIVQYRMYIPNSWRIFMFKDMSLFWGDSIGGTKYLGILSMLIVGFTSILTALNFKKIKNNQIVYLIPVMLFIMLLVNRYYHGQRSEVYLLYLYPFILFTVALSFDLLLDAKLFFKNRFVSYLIYFIFFVLIAGNSLMLHKFFVNSWGNISYFEKTAMQLKDKYPNTKFFLYDYGGKNTAVSQALTLVLKSQNLESKDGKKIALGCIPDSSCSRVAIPIENTPLVDISMIPAKDIEKEYKNRSSYEIYDSLIGWSHLHALTHTFNLKNYILERL